MHQAGLAYLAPETGPYHHPSPGVFTTARIWSSRTVAANKPGVETRWARSVFIPTWEGFAYLATVMDCYPR